MRISTEQGEGNEGMTTKIFLFLKKNTPLMLSLLLNTQKPNLYKTINTENGQRGCYNAKSSDLF